MPKREPKPTWTKVRAIRSPDHIWEPAMAQAAEDGKTVTDVVNAYLYRYGRHQRAKAKEAPTSDG